MQQAFADQHRRILAKIAAAGARLRGPARGRLPKTFLRAYYANVATPDLAMRDSHELAALAASHLAFARRRRGRALVRVFNPTVRDHGYVSAHTVVEMVNDDMPFLVDSIGLALARRSLTLHFLVHPILEVARNGASQAAIYMALSLLVGAFVASVSAALGGHLRDEHP